MRFFGCCCCCFLWLKAWFKTCSYYIVMVAHRTVAIMCFLFLDLLACWRALFRGESSRSIGNRDRVSNWILTPCQPHRTVRLCHKQTHITKFFSCKLFLKSVLKTNRHANIKQNTHTQASDTNFRSVSPSISILPFCRKNTKGWGMLVLSTIPSNLSIPDKRKIETGMDRNN